MGESAPGSPPSACTLDAKGLGCPLPILKTKVALSRMKAGEVLHVAATDPHSVIDFKAFCARTPMSSFTTRHTTTSSSSG